MTMQAPRKLLLINPANKARKGFIHDQGTRFMPLGLGIVAALTPPHWEIELLDESFEEFTFKPADLVAFTSFTASAPRAYEIAALYREKGIHTVMGGIHASMFTEEAVNYIDTVVTGEAEGAWPALINDFESGKIKNLYDGGIVDIKTIPHVRRDIYKYPYVYDLVQTSRGCPMDCDFCSVSRLCGKTYREREVDEVLDELEKTTRPLLLFVDDNLVNNKKGADERAIRLFKGMVERGIKKFWTSQAALNFADNAEVLYWARKSGCVIILMGIEAETAHALKSVRKNLNLKRGVGSYEKVFRKIHRHGIGILATMIFGMENDKKEDLYARRDFIKNSSIDMYQCTILTPLPGTALYDRMKEQNHIILNNYPSDWQQYHFFIATVNTPSMKREEIESSMHEIWLSLFNKEAMRRKMFRTLWNTKSIKTAYFAYAGNHSYGRMFLEGIFHTNPNGVDTNFEWKNRKRTLYLNFTDKVVWLFYQLAWMKIVKHFSGKL
ncbi:MAG: B12-binding domain-containing radical SAM protein [Bacteroidales bacterium]|nr:B12-binding domain-containing radical SAM protein [Bacteroidales bacterium]